MPQPVPPPSSSTRYTRPRPEASRGVVVSFCPVASAMGSRVLFEGGNAADAAVATALALAVTYPQAGNIGGGGFLLADFDGVEFLDFREAAPRALTAEMLLDGDQPSSASVLGPLSVGVPGSVAGLAALLERHGTMSWASVVDRIIPLATEGMWLTSRQAGFLNGYAPYLKMYPSSERAFFPQGRPARPGDRFVQADLARCLTTLRDEGAEAFYSGSIAREIVTQMRTLGGVLDEQDLSEYRARWRTPLSFPWFGRTAYVPALPSGGGHVLRIAAGLFEAEVGGGEGSKLPDDDGVVSAALARAFRAAFGIGTLTGDPDDQPADARRQLEILSNPAVLAQGIDAMEHRLLAPSEMEGPNDTCTTHYSVLDRDGNAVSCTTSLNTLFGSKLVAGNCGFLLNNCIDDFRIAAHIPNWYNLLMGSTNQLGPGRRPQSSMCPTIVKNQGETELVLGAAGGPRIPTALGQVMLGTLGRGLSLSDATMAARLHHQRVPDTLYVEEAMADDVVDALRGLGLELSSRQQCGIVAAIRQETDTGALSAILDPRFGDFW